MQRFLVKWRIVISVNNSKKNENHIEPSFMANFSRVSYSSVAERPFPFSEYAFVTH